MGREEKEGRRLDEEFAGYILVMRVGIRVTSSCSHIASSILPCICSILKLY